MPHCTVLLSETPKFSACYSTNTNAASMLAFSSLLVQSNISRALYLCHRRIGELFCGWQSKGAWGCMLAGWAAMFIEIIDDI